MALYDNKHWLLSHIRNSFISADDTGMCEVIMTGENLRITANNADKYPGIEENDDEDDLAHSLDNHSDLEYGLRRQRSNTAIRLEKMNREKREAANITNIKWNNPRPFSSLSDEDKLEMFGGKVVETSGKQERKMSLLTQQLQKCLYQPQTPFREYAKFDGNAQVGIPVRKYGIFLTMMKPAAQSNYPMHVSVISSAKVSDLIGFILWRCSYEFPDFPLKDNVKYYGLHIAEDDGEVDWVFPCLDPKETVSKFVFKMLALVEKSGDEQESDKHSAVETDKRLSTSLYFPFKQEPSDESPEVTNEEYHILQDQMSALDSFLYKSYKVLLLSKVRTKVEVNLGISGEKIDIDPVLKQSTGAKFLSKRKPTSYGIDYVVACDLTETKSNNKAVFRLVYDSSQATDANQSSSYPEFLSWHDFKHRDFECVQNIAEEIVQKLNHILELRSSNRRKEYLLMRERKSHRRRSFHIGPR